MKQGKLTIDEYTSQYQELEILCGLWESNKNNGARYIKGLRPSIRAKVNFCETIPEAYKEAIRVEHMLRKSRMCQSQCQERKIQQRSRAHVVERLIPGEDNPTIVIRQLFNTSKKEKEE